MNEFPGLKGTHSVILVGLTAWKRHWLNKRQKAEKVKS